MEYELWAGKYQQSVPQTSSERSDDNLNNGNSEEDGETNPKAGEEDGEGAVKVENEQDSAPATISVSEKGKQIIQAIQEQIKTLSPIEKFLLFLKLPSEITNAVDPFRQPLNPLGSRSEIYKTISWIKTHLEEDPDISLPKQEVYTDYLNYCEGNGIKALSQADFGKVMKQVYPKVRARRLGTRGNSRYCYSGLSRCSKLKAPFLPDLANKPLSTEAPFTPSNRAAAAWLIVKSWAEQQLGQDFASIEALAAHILSNFPIASDTEAAAIIASATSESAPKGGESGNGKSNSNHREMQLQLQRKIQQKNEGKERKRKLLQSPKAEQHKLSGKKTCRSQSVPAPSSSASPGQAAVSTSGECSAASSGSTSPSSVGPAAATVLGGGRNIICDKILSTTSSSTSSLDFTTLPDFNSLQRPQAPSTATTDLLLGQEGNLSSANSGQVMSKVPIPRLPSTSTSALASRRSSVIPVTSPQKKQVKYKLVQPRQPPQQQQPCDIVSYNPRPSAEGQNGSQLTLNRISKEQEVCVDDDVDFPLTRERFDSVSNVEKDAMDEYLGTNNSQHEEELSKYFSNNNVTTTGHVDEQTSKLSTLRQLLEQTVDNKPIMQPLIQTQKTVSDEINFANVDFSKTIVKSEVTYITPITNSLALSNMNSKRRVSFETPMDEAVPPSPNTRRKNFSFTPISPGPLSPNGVQSKCSSTTASPFVSPRNTPVLRTKPVSILKPSDIRKPVKIKKELSLDLSSEPLVTSNQLPMAEQVPMLQKLLKSNTKVCYDPAYSECHGQEQQQQQQFFVGDVDTGSSQSVPVHELLDTVPDISFVLNPQQSTTDFTIPTASDPLCAPNLFGMNAANEYGIQLIDNNMAVQEFDTQAAEENHLVHSSFGSARIGRSQSIDMAMGFTEKCIAPSRSVPVTPLPFGTGLKVSSKPDFAISKSHPSTPLTGTTFTYNFNRDCLLNGQPIHTDELDCVPVIYDNGVIEQQKDFGIVDDQFAIADNTIGDCDLMEQNFNSNIN